MTTISVSVTGNDTSILRYTRIRSTVDGLRIRSKPPTLYHVEVNISRSDGIAYEGYLHDKLVLDSVSVTFPESVGIRLKPENRATEEVHILNSHLGQCGDTCVIHEGSGNLVMTSTNITTSNTWVLQEQFIPIEGLSDYGSVQVENCIFSGQLTNGLKFYNAKNIAITNNTFRDNKKYSLLSFGSRSSESITIEGNTFRDNINAELIRGYWNNRKLTYSAVQITGGVSTKVTVSTFDKYQ